LPPRGPFWHSGIRSKAADGELLRQQGKFKTTLGRRQ
jgi:hypothetical protein